MEKQEIFNKVVTHLRTQGKAAYSTEHGCMYRHPSGTKCALGCLIPDADYKPTFEGCAPADDSERNEGAKEFNAYCIAKFGKDNLQFLEELQKVHDNAAGQSLDFLMAEWEHRFAEVARDWDLTVPR